MFEYYRLTNKTTQYHCGWNKQRLVSCFVKPRKHRLEKQNKRRYERLLTSSMTYLNATESHARTNALQRTEQLLNQASVMQRLFN